jgi:hypothetical protein
MATAVATASARFCVSVNSVSIAATGIPYPDHAVWSANLRVAFQVRAADHDRDPLVTVAHPVGPSTTKLERVPTSHSRAESAIGEVD